MFALELEINEQVKKYIKEVNQKLDDNDVVKNPYYGRAFIVPNSPYLVVDLKPVTPRFYLLGFPSLLVGIFFWWPWIIGASLFVISLGFFWTNTFQSFFFRIGIKKNGYSKNIKAIRLEKVIPAYERGVNYPHSGNSGGK